MVVVSSVRAAFRIAARPSAPVHHLYASATGVFREWQSGEQIPHHLSVDPSAIQGGVEATPATTKDTREAQVKERRDASSGRDGVADFEEGVGAMAEASVEPRAEGGELPHWTAKLSAFAFTVAGADRDHARVTFPEMISSMSAAKWLEDLAVRLRRRSRRCAPGL